LNVSQIFISDLHLDASTPVTVEHFTAFLHAHCRAIEALYILGDLYEAWIGDDDDSDLAECTQSALAACHASGTAIYLQRGNRDFLLGTAFAERIGAQLLPDYAVIQCAGEPTLLMHGDLLCTQDSDYLAFRAQVRQASWQKAFLAQPLSARRAFAEQARQASQARQRQLHDDGRLETITDVTPTEVLKTLSHYGVRRLIHGHTHRPARHALTVDGQAAERIVLGDWYTQTSHLSAGTNSLVLSYQQSD
jgi:UDP-2,3-diacylglucosamine hydrolase